MSCECAKSKILLLLRFCSIFLLWSGRLVLPFQCPLNRRERVQGKMFEGGDIVEVNDAFIKILNFAQRLTYR